MNKSGNTILITGGSKGIGFEMAKTFIAEGNTVIITGRNQKRLDEAKQKLGDVTTFQSDVSDPASIETLFNTISSQFPTLNVLVNNAGVMDTINLQNHELNTHQLTRELDINVKGNIWMNDKFLPLLKKNGSSAIVTVSSGLAFVPLPISPVYCASKAAVHSYTQSLRAQLSNTNVKVFELAPPATETELISKFNEEDMKGTTLMTPSALVNDFMKGFAKDKYEICPGQASQLKFMSRFFPGFIFKQMSKSLEGMRKS